MTATAFPRGIRENPGSGRATQLIQVMLVGFAIGMTRTVVPALAESEFGLERGSFLLLISLRGGLRRGAGGDELRRRALVGTHGAQAGADSGAGGSQHCRSPCDLVWRPTGTRIVAATVLLGVNQGLCCSDDADREARDITKAEERGLTMGLNEFLRLCRRRDRRHS